MPTKAALALYRALAGHRPAPYTPAQAERPARPRGRLVWLHVPDRAELPAALELARRITEERSALTLLITTFGDPPDLPRRLLVQTPPGEGGALENFLSYWTPDAGAQVGGQIDPQFLASVRAAMPFHLIQPALPASAALRLVPGLTRSVLSPLARIVAPDQAAARTLRRLAGPTAAIEIAGRLEPVPAALPCNEAERDAMARSIAARPVWLAAAVPEIELGAVIEAHRIALRLAHRLLLIVVPDSPSLGELYAERLASEGWTVARRSAEQELEEECEVYVADTEGEFGLWFRLAPICYLGGSLLGAGSIRPPHEPAALGSGVLHGPRYGAQFEEFARLTAARATREVRSGADLGEAVGDLLAADKVAALAHDAWAAGTAGAEVVERLARLLVGAAEARADAGERTP